MNAPVAKQIPFEWQRPTGAASDPWAWLRNREDPDTIAYLDAENRYADEFFATHSAFVETVFEEIKSRVLETDLEAPVRKDTWWYTSRTEEGKSYPIHCRGTSRETATDNVLLDENIEADGHAYFSLGAFAVSPDHRLLAWSSDTDGGERYTMKFRDLATGAELADTLTDTAWGGCAWSVGAGADSDTLWVLYVKPDEAMRPFQVWRHRMGTDQAADALVFEDLDERFFVSVDLTRSDEWIVIESSSKVSSEVALIAASDPTAAPAVVRPRADDIEYHLDHWGDRFVIVTNLEAEDFRVMTAPVAEPSQWTEFLAHEAGRRIVGAEPFATHLVVHEWHEAQQRLRVLWADGREHVIDLGLEPHEVELEANPEWHTTTVRFSYQSFTTPASVFEEDLSTGTRTLLKQKAVPGVDLSRYTATREWAVASDGTRVPVDVMRLSDAVANSSAPCVVYGYGSYEISLPPWFSVARLSLIDRGWTFAVVHPRGGGELGRRWYLDGKLLSKVNTFSDTIACCEHLVAAGWAASGRVALRGGSAGGLLVGACINMRPDLFASAIAEVPFVDVVSTMSDPSLPLTVTEWEEWGDPREEPSASYMLGYSPYDNLGPHNYPAIYVTAGLNDPRVSYHEPAKWVAKLREIRGNDVPLIFKCEMGAGHGGPSGRYEMWRDEARVLAFLAATTSVPRS
jgi:oligopeptidase B